METPDLNWQKEIFDEDMLEDLERGHKECKPEIIQWTKDKYSDGLSKGESPEAAALLIGGFAKYVAGSDYFVACFENHIGDDEGEKLALGFIGAQSIEELTEDA